MHRPFVVDRRELFKTRIYQYHRNLVFASLVYSWVFIFVGPSYGRLKLVFFMLFIDSEFLLCHIRFHILLQKCFVSFASVCWLVLVYSPPTCLKNFHLLFLKFLFYLYCLTLSRYLLNLPPFTNIFWLISSSSVVRHVSSRFFVFAFCLVPVCFTFFSSFASDRSFFSCFSGLISHPDFVFLFGFPGEILILSLTNFAPA